MDMWVIHERPADFPQAYVARKVRILESGVRITDSVIVAPNLLELQMVMENMGLTQVQRSHNDPPNIIETWL